MKINTLATDAICIGHAILSGAHAVGLVSAVESGNNAWLQSCTEKHRLLSNEDRLTFGNSLKRQVSYPSVTISCKHKLYATVMNDSVTAQVDLTT
jgi:hypothetical protein